MRKWILIFVAMLLFGFEAMAQIPRTLQISVTNGTVMVSSQTSPGNFFGSLETATNLSPPVVWSGTTSPILASSVSSNFPVANQQTFFRLVQHWPMFEFAIFYNMNLEIDPGAAININGPVFSNAGLWAGTANLTFNSTVSAVNQVNITSTDPFATGKTDGSGPPHFNLTGQPTSGNSALFLPMADVTNSNPTNVEAILNIPPPAYAMGTANAYTTNGQEFLANAADLVISNSVYGTNWGILTPKGTNMTIYYQDSANAPALTKLTPDFYIITNGIIHTLFATNYVSSTLLGPQTNIYYAGWSFATNIAFWDYRESKTVQAVQFNVAKFNIWMTNISANGGNSYNAYCNAHKGRSIDGIWAYNSVPLSSTTLPAVRLINGVQLPDSWGLTVATPMPIYVYGDYNKQTDPTHVSSGTNTTYTYPAALMCDAITILSGNWSDGNTSSTSIASRIAANTIVNAACLEGIVQSTGSHYSGGVENFLRFLENWSSVSNIYNGSIVVMFPSIYATNYWPGTGSVYNAPTRSWGFDLNFLQQSKLPPITPMVVNFSSP